MFKLPFHIDSPLAVGLFALLATVLFSTTRWAHEYDHWIALPIKWIFERKLKYVAPEKARLASRAFLTLMVVSFGLMSMLGILTGTEIIQNGDPPPARFLDIPPAMTVDEFLKKRHK